jgi:hypothetical protein
VSVSAKHLPHWADPVRSKARCSLLTALLATLWAGIQPSTANADAPHCHAYANGGYCQYDGRVREAYINAYNEVILYFDTPFDAAHAASVGLSGITVTGAAKFNMASNKDFGKSLFAALLAAQARGANVSVQMHSVAGGWLVIDRIWVKE